MRSENSQISTLERNNSLNYDQSDITPQLRQKDFNSNSPSGAFFPKSNSVVSQVLPSNTGSTLNFQKKHSDQLIKDVNAFFAFFAQNNNNATTQKSLDFGKKDLQRNEL